MLNQAFFLQSEPDESRRVEHIKQTSPTPTERLSAWCVNFITFQQAVLWAAIDFQRGIIIIIIIGTPTDTIGAIAPLVLGP